MRNLKLIAITMLLMISFVACAGDSKFTTKVSDENFPTTVIESSSDNIVLVDFWAPWCGPCRRLGPMLEKMAEKYQGKITVAKLNVDDNKKYARKYKISSIPAVKVFKNGKVIDEFVGLMPEAQLEKFIKKQIAE